MENNSQVPAAGSTFVRRYGIALLAAAGVMAVRLALMPLLGTRPPYITFYLGTVIAAAYGGMGPGLLVTFIGVAFGFVVLPAGPVVIAQEATRLGLFVLSGFGICLVAEGMHRQRRKVQEQAEELGRVAERLAELDRAKTAFFSNVSHEFRTPLTLILGPTEEALNSPGRALTGADLATVHRNALRLLKLVNTLLDFARIEAGRIDASYQPTDLSRLTADLASVFRSAVEKAGLSLFVDCPPLPEDVYVDRDMWEKIVLNLLSNASKFTFEGEIEVSLRQADGEVELSVRDTGTGIPDAELPHIFDRFHHVKSTRARTHEGTGIGLALVQELVKLHSGRIKVESRLGEGTTFRVRVPLGRGHLLADRIEAPRSRVTTSVGATPFVEEVLRWIPDAASGDAVAEPPAMPEDDLHFPPQVEKETARVLVAEDNADMREYLRQILGRHWAVEAVADGAAALAAASGNPPDLVLADVMMPGLDGFELMRSLRAEPTTREIPIVLLSARAGEEARVEGMAAGADDYLVKPFSARELVTRIGTHLELSRVRREAAREVRASKDRLSAAVAIAKMGIWEYDTDAAVTYFDERSREIFGLAEDRPLSNEEVFALVHIDDLPRVQEEVRCALDNKGTGIYESEYRIIRQDGRLRWVAVRGHAIRASETPGDKMVQFVGTLMDITDRKETEEALKQAKDAAEIASRAKSEFLANMSHEIRTPMTVFMSALEYLLQIDRNPERRRLLEMADQSANRLRALIEDVLDFSRIEARRVDLEEESFDVRACVDEAVGMFVLPARERNFRLETEVAPETPHLIVGDQNRLGQVLVNLLGNAVKFTHEGKIRVCVQPRDDLLEFSVADTGIGIPEDKRDRLFESFTQADSSYTRKYGGTGLGLTISKGLVELMGGEIFVRGREGGGSIFTFTLPLKSVEDHPPTLDEVSPDVGRPAKARILLAEDEPLVREMITMMLTQKGWQIEIAETGREAVERWEEGVFDLILMDLTMPKMSGLDATRTIRAREAAVDQRTCIIGLTAHARREIQEECLQAGMDRVLTKPVKMHDLYTAINECLID